METTGIKFIHKKTWYLIILLKEVLSNINIVTKVLKFIKISYYLDIELI
jgi:hypothetical protein